MIKNNFFFLNIIIIVDMFLYFGPESPPPSSLFVGIYFFGRSMMSMYLPTVHPWFHIAMDTCVVLYGKRVLGLIPDFPNAHPTIESEAPSLPRPAQASHDGQH